MRGRRDAGTVLPFVAFCMIGLLAVVAVVVDLGATRSLRRDTRAAADAGAAAGAMAIGSPAPGAACFDALSYAFSGLSVTQPSGTAISTACAGMTAVCSGTTARVAALTVDNVTVRVVNPVPDGSSLMNGTSLGSGVPQSINSVSDGVPCDRVGVEITRPQPTVFRGVITGGSSSFTVHSVARYAPQLRGLLIPPALVALNRTACNAIDAGNNGNIILMGNSIGPGIAFSDSDGPSCSGTNPILASRSSARLVAESSGSTVGQLAWFSAPSTRGYNNSSTTYQLAPASFATTTQNYVGQLFARSERTTRAPVDKAFHCTNVPTSVQPLCTTTDPVADLQTLSTASATAAPSGYATYSGSCDTTGAAVTLPTGNVWINCPTFTVKGNPLRIPGGGTVIFNGSLSVEANGTLLVNTSGTTDASGYPTPTDSTNQTTLLLNATGASAFNISSNSSALYLAQTTVFNKGGFTLSSSQAIHWTPPTAGVTRSLLYWSESTNPFSIQGGPQIHAKGIMFHGNGLLTGGGGGTIDLTKVQMWVDSVSTGGSTTVKLSADPDNSIKIFGPGSALIR